MIAALPASTVRRIKSGQVVSDVRSVVKELLENALDAGASCVRVCVGGCCGVDSVVVADNGSGIAAADRALCGRAHATSKLASYDALARVATYGFRGEALHALRQCARAVTIYTRTASDPAPEEIILTASSSTSSSNSSSSGETKDKEKDKDKDKESVLDLPPMVSEEALDGFTTGTAVRVTGLWAHQPVRAAYVRAAVAQQPAREIKRLVDLVQTYALARPGVRFVLTFRDAARARPFACGPCADVAGAVAAVFGPLLFDELAHVHHASADGAVVLDGWLPARGGQQMVTMRKVNDRMFTFLNGRPVDLPHATRYITAVCRKWFCAGRRAYPFVCLHVALAPGTFDVNVSPDKRRVFLQDEEQLLACVREVTAALYPVRVTPVEEDDGADDSVDTSSAAPLAGVLSQRLRDPAPVGLSQASVAGQRLLTYDADDLLDVDVSQPRDCLRAAPSPPQKVPRTTADATADDKGISNSSSDWGLTDRLYGRDAVAAVAAAATAATATTGTRLVFPETTTEAVCAGLPQALRLWCAAAAPVVADCATRQALASPTFGHALAVVGACQTVAGAGAGATWCFVVREALAPRQWRLWLLPWHRAEECAAAARGGGSGAAPLSPGRPSLARGAQLLALVAREHQTHCGHQKPLFAPLCTVELAHPSSSSSSSSSSSMSFVP